MGFGTRVPQWQPPESWHHSGYSDLGLDATGVGWGEAGWGEVDGGGAGWGEVGWGENGRHGEPNDDREKAMSTSVEPMPVKRRTKRGDDGVGNVLGRPIKHPKRDRYPPIPKPTSRRTMLESFREKPPVKVGGSYSRPLAESSTTTSGSRPLPSHPVTLGSLGEERPAGAGGAYSHPLAGPGATGAESHTFPSLILPPLVLPRGSSDSWGPSPNEETRPRQFGLYSAISEFDNVRPGPAPLASTLDNLERFGVHPVADPNVEHQVMLTLMKSLLGKKASQKALLECRGEKTQQVLDIMQKLLDNASIDDASRRLILVATLRLCRESSGYPACLTLQGVQREGRPVTDGKFGEIWRGHFRGNAVCMKVVKLYQRSQVEHLIKNFAREAIMWSQLSHPNLLPFYGIYHWDDRVCLVSPWMSNGNISEYLKADPEAPRRPLIDDILAGLAHLHGKSIVHGDLKGVNILVTSSGTACLADFGLSSVVDADILRWTSLETVSYAGGTLRWEAPELFDSSDEDEVPRPTFAADVYSVASVMYEVLTGRIPFYEIPRDATVMKRVMSGVNPSKPSPDVRLELSSEIWEVMERCWSRIPGNRPTVGTIIKRLQQIRPNPLTMTRIAQWRARGGNRTSQLLTPSLFRAAIQGGNQTFSAHEFNLLKEMLR